MGLRACVMKAIGTTMFRSPNNPASSKEADAALKPATRTGAQDWPSFVIETGPSESLQRLRVDADWWLINGNEDVQMVLLICVGTTPKCLQLETWEARPSPVSHLRTNRPRSTKTLETMIETNNQGVSTVRGPALQVLIPWVTIFDRPIDRGKCHFCRLCELYWALV